MGLVNMGMAYSSGWVWLPLPHSLPTDPPCRRPLGLFSRTTCDVRGGYSAVLSGAHKSAGRVRGTTVAGRTRLIDQNEGVSADLSVSRSPAESTLRQGLRESDRRTSLAAVRGGTG